MKRVFVMGLAASALAGIAALGAQGSNEVQRPAPPMAGIHWARGAGPRSSGSPNLIYHGGPVMTGGGHVEPIFWGTSWTAGDPKIAAMQTFYAGIGSSSYEATNTEYTDSRGVNVGTLISLGSTHIDTSSAPSSGGNTSPILAEVCSQISAPQSDGYYPVYVDSPRHGNYCAYHSVGTCGGVSVQFAFFYNLDGDAGCDPQDTSTGHPQGIAALGNVSGHELSEALTDQHLDAWYDSGGAENADKCAWSFGSSFLTFSNGTKWKIQGNWSNRAFSGGTGYPNSSGQKGCIDGH